jgi:Spy/CpxP family protein refolding chaperone
MKLLSATAVAFVLGGALLASTALLLVRHRAPGPESTPAPEAAPACCSELALPMCCEQLGLSDDQVTNLIAACSSTCEDVEDLAAESERALTELESRLAADVVDRAAIDRLTTEIAELRRKELASRVDAILAVRTELTPEQRSKIRELLRGKE